ncbi:hypothetical protein [Kribbella sp. HUAS MG21]|uniref:Uncharacterized protein n=1 Tax=Kribbella sp. HUAS MG21 TaxID=3160966 RepID=A0AAU7T787_9ACTN
MEPLNLMVSLSHFANDNREHKHGLSTPAGSGRPTNRTRGRRVPSAPALQNLRRIWARRVRVLG